MVYLQAHVTRNDHAGGDPEQLTHEEGHDQPHRDRLLHDRQDDTSAIGLGGPIRSWSGTPWSANNCASGRPSPAVFPIANTVVVCSDRANRASTTLCSVSACRTSMRSERTPPRSACFTTASASSPMTRFRSDSSDGSSWPSWRDLKGRSLRVFTSV